MTRLTDMEIDAIARMIERVGLAETLQAVGWAHDRLEGCTVMSDTGRAIEAFSDTVEAGRYAADRIAVGWRLPPYEGLM